MKKKNHVQTYIRNEYLEYGTLNLTIAQVCFSAFHHGVNGTQRKNIIKILENTQYEQMGLFAIFGKVFFLKDFY
jgi:hypothetical protein